MDSLLSIDWQALFAPQFSLLEMVVRGVAVYLGVSLLLRFVLKRQAGKIGLSDLLVVMLVAGVCRNPLVADAYSITDGLGVVAVVLGCSFLVDAASYHIPWVRRIINPEPVLLIRDGKVLEESLQREMMNEAQLLAKLRGHGTNDISQVAEAWIESSGDISVVRYSGDRGHDSSKGQSGRRAALRCAVRQLHEIARLLEEEQRHAEDYAPSHDSVPLSARGLHDIHGKQA